MRSVDLVHKKSEKKVKHKFSYTMPFFNYLFLNEVTCPAIPEGQIGACAEFCADDDSCPTGKMCCSNGCGHACMEAVPSKYIN